MQYLFFVSKLFISIVTLLAHVGLLLPDDAISIKLLAFFLNNTLLRSLSTELSLFQTLVLQELFSPLQQLCQQRLSIRTARRHFVKTCSFFVNRRTICADPFLPHAPPIKGR